MSETGTPAEQRPADVAPEDALRPEEEAAVDRVSWWQRFVTGSTTSIGLILATCLGGYLSAGGAGAINHVFDRDIDARMARTADRPVPAGLGGLGFASFPSPPLAAARTSAFVTLPPGPEPLTALRSTPLAQFTGT